MSTFDISSIIVLITSIETQRNGCSFRSDGKYQAFNIN